MKIVDNRIRNVVRYKDLAFGDVFLLKCRNIVAPKVERRGKICMKTSLAIESYDEDSEIYGLKKMPDGKFRQEFYVDLETGLHFEADPEVEVEKLNTRLEIVG